MKQFLKNIKLKRFFKSETCLVILITLVGLGLRIIFLDSRPPTLDEAFSLLIAKANTLEIIRGILADNHPPLYYLLLSFWLKLNHNLAFLRLMSTLFGVVTIPVAAFVGKKLFNSKTGLIASLMVAFSPVLILESTNLRMYSLAFLESTLVLYFFLKYLENRKNSDLLWLGIFSVLGIYTHYYFALIIFTLNLFFLFQVSRHSPKWRIKAIINNLNISKDRAKQTVPAARKQRDRGLSGLGGLFNRLKYRKNFINWFTSQSVVFILSIPLIFLFLKSDHPLLFPVTQSLLKIPALIAVYAVSWDAIQILKTFPFRFWTIINLPFFLLAGGLFLAFLSGSKSLKKSSKFCFFLLYLILPTLILFLISWLYKPIFGVRSMIIFSPAYYLAVAYGLAKAKRGKVYLETVLLLAALFLVFQYQGFTKIKNQPIAYDYVKINSLPTDIYLHSDSMSFIIGRYYLGDKNQFGAVPTWLSKTTQKTINYNIIPVNEINQKGNRVWYFLLDPGYFNKDLSTELQSELETKYKLISSQKFPDDQLRISLFELKKP